MAQELLATYGSPLYVYRGDRLRQTICQITHAIPYPRTQFHFASVTNGNISLLRIFRESGWGLHANTPGDIYLGLQAGFHPSQVVYSGSNLNRDEMAQILHWGIKMLNLDSLSQMQLFCEVYEEMGCGVWGVGYGEEIQNSKFKIQNSKFSSPSSISPPSSLSLPRLGLRLNLPALTGDSRIGVRPEEFSAAIALAQKVGLKLSGLHFYRGTGTNATVAFTQVIDRVLAIAQQLPDWEFLDFGGGFGYPYRQHGIAFNWQQFGRELSDRLEQLDRSIELVIEPGRAAIAGCATLLCRVVSVKWQAEKQIVGVDTTVANLSVPSVHGGYREIVALAHPTPHTPHPTDICGNTTYSRDYLGKNCLLPALEIGDILAILDVGAYGYAMSSHFLHRPRPAEVLLQSGSHRLIRKREDYSILLENQVFEAI
ncbi:decarboxylase [Kovacikia minuta CCNUW1]|uniref:diaminopimelate decarboxylase family protein n=1 Tax=Kovacikia minuta TaxID=2931930 RepID=UPI001CCA37B0|nr:decarboxylase [Kovacikia minuta CCNUW1]